MKFKVGDIVQYTPDICLCGQFVNRWGRGPFIVAKTGGALELTTMDKVPLTNEEYGERAWTHTSTLLTKNKFLDFINQAIAKEPNAKSKTRTKQKAKPVSRRSGAA